MTLIRDKEVRNWDSDKYGARLIELDKLATEALQEAENLEGQAKGLRCKANQHQLEASEIVRARTPSLNLEMPRD